MPSVGKFTYDREHGDTILIVFNLSQETLKCGTSSTWIEVKNSLANGTMAMISRPAN
jgi:hypothetical protein